MLENSKRPADKLKKINTSKLKQTVKYDKILNSKTQINQQTRVDNTRISQNFKKVWQYLNFKTQM